MEQVELVIIKPVLHVKQEPLRLLQVRQVVEQAVQLLALPPAEKVLPVQAVQIVPLVINPGLQVKQLPVVA